LEYTLEEVIRLNCPQNYYRNLFLIGAMVNLNMIETIGNGIRKIFTIQKERYFPMPTYDISDEEHTIVTIHGGLVDENYTYQLSVHPDLSMEDVIVLDKVQKKQEISKTELERLRLLKLVKGRSSSLKIVGNATPAGFLTNKDYKQMILNLLAEKGSVQRDDIEKLLIPLLPENLSLEKRQKKISNIITELSYKEGKIKNVSLSTKTPVWKLN
jgi:ATP-dependent DNA helicase RecG